VPGTGRSLLRAADSSCVNGDADGRDTDAKRGEDGVDGVDTDAERGEEGVDTDAERGEDGVDGVDTDAERGEDGVDTEHVMNLTFVVTLLLGVPAVVVLSLFVPLDGWGEILGFVVRVGAAIWFLTAAGLYVRERRCL